MSFFVLKKTAFKTPVNQHVANLSSCKAFEKNRRVFPDFFIELTPSCEKMMVSSTRGNIPVIEKLACFLSSPSTSLIEVYKIKGKSQLEIRETKQNLH
jgi:hypothetical protein